MPNQVDGALVHAMSGNELSRVRTELYQLRIVPTLAPHPVQPNSEFSGHRHLGNVFLSTHRQVNIPTSPAQITAHRCLRCFAQQIAQQSIALFADVSQPLVAGTGVFTGDEPNVAADLLAASKALRSPDNQHEGQRREWAHAR